MSHPTKFSNKSVCELGAGLGLVSILLEKTNSASYIVATDGDDDTIDLLNANKIANNASFLVQKLYWGGADDALLLQQYPDKFDMLLAADVIYEVDQVVPLISSVCNLLKGVSTCCRSSSSCCIARVVVCFDFRSCGCCTVTNASASSGLEITRCHNT